jgi:hypothetical protein
MNTDSVQCHCSTTTEALVCFSAARGALPMSPCALLFYCGGPTQAVANLGGTERLC